MPSRAHDWLAQARRDLEHARHDLADRAQKGSGRPGTFLWAHTARLVLDPSSVGNPLLRRALKEGRRFSRAEILSGCRLAT